MLHLPSDQGLHCLPKSHKKELGAYGLKCRDQMANKVNPDQTAPFRGGLIRAYTFCLKVHISKYLQ